MPPRSISAGLLLYRRREGRLEVFLIHPGGPFWAARDLGAWQIPKGTIELGETPLEAAIREFGEETGHAPVGVPLPLGRVRQAGGKWVEAFVLAGDIDPDTVVSNMFEMEWPPRSGRMRSFPEVDRAAWYGIPEARIRMLASQQPLLDLLHDYLDAAEPV